MFFEKNVNIGAVLLTKLDFKLEGFNYYYHVAWQLDVY